MAEKNETIREDVSRAYARAVEKAAKSPGGCCCGGSKPTGPAAFTAGYGAETTDLPAGAVQSSFGCGNPVGLAVVREGDVVLDLGSGAGLDLLVAATKVGPEGSVIGVDMTDEMLDAARRHVEEGGVTNVELRKGIIEELPVEDASVDVVVSNCVLNLSPEKERVFAEIGRVLRPGGRISISDIVVEEFPAELREIAALRSACVAGAISEADYVAGLEAAGLVDVAVTDRLVYDVDQLRSIAVSDFADAGVSEELLNDLVDRVVGKVWSARFSGRMP